MILILALVVESITLFIAVKKLQGNRKFDEIKDDFRKFTKLILKTTDRIPRLVGNHIDEIEKKIQEEFPEIIYVDIEIN